MKTADKLSKIARTNQPEQVKENLYESFNNKVNLGSLKYVDFVINQCKELSMKGYGSVKITIDKTTDLFNTDEGRNSCYSSQLVVSLLTKEGFEFLSYYDKNVYIDHYDAFSDIISWDKTLSTAPNSMKIGMSWI